MGERKTEEKERGGRENKGSEMGEKLQVREEVRSPLQTDF